MRGHSRLVSRPLYLVLVVGRTEPEDHPGIADWGEGGLYLIVRGMLCCIVNGFMHPVVYGQLIKSQFVSPCHPACGGAPLLLPVKLLSIRCLIRVHWDHPEHLQAGIQPFYHDIIAPVLQPCFSI